MNSLIDFIAAFVFMFQMNDEKLKTNQKSPNLGFLSIRYKSNTLKGGCVEYTLATLTHFIQRKCEEGWMWKIPDQCKRLNIHILYIVGEDQKKSFKKVLSIPLRNHRPNRNNYKFCHYCRKRTCSAVKSMVAIKNVTGIDIKINCCMYK